jgi:hypothetical protein
MPAASSIKRFPNYELLRVFAFLTISLMHGARSAYGHSVGFVAINTIGNMGVTLFVLISGFFGIRLRASKIIWLWTTTLFYSLLLFAVQCYLTEIPCINNGNAKEFIKLLYTALTPITSNTWWFVTSYIIVMLLSPLFNKAADSMSKLQFQYLITILAIVYSLSPTFLMHSLSDVPNGKCTENMILAYFIGRYFAKMGIPRTIQCHATTILLVCVTVIFSINYFVFDPLFLAKDHSLFIILGAICIFYFFGNISIQSTTVGNIIRYMATYAFPFYLLNVFLISHLEFQYCSLSGWEYCKGYLIVQAVILGISFLIEFARRLIMEHLIRKPSRYFDRKVEQLKHKGAYGIYLNFFFTK